MRRPREFDGGLVAGFFGAVEVALEFNEDVAGAEGSDESVQRVGRRLCAKSPGEGTFRAAGQADQAFGEFGKVGGGGGGFVAGLRVFRADPQFHPGYELAEVLVALLIADEEGVARAVRRRDFGSDMRLDADLFRRTEEPRRSVNAIDVGQCHGRLAVIRRQ